MDKYAKKVKENGEEVEIVHVTNASKIEQYLWEEYHKTSKQKTVLERSKMIKKINYQVQIPLEETKIFYVSKSVETIETPFGKIELTGISGSKIQFNVPSVIKEKTLAQALYKYARILRFRNSNNFTLFSNEKIEAYENYIKVLEQTQKLVSSNIINSEEKLEEYLAENTPKSLKNIDENSSITQVNMEFSGPIDKVAFMVTISDSQLRTFQGTADLAYSDDEKDYMVAQDFETRKLGILSKNGNWLVQPQFDDYFRKINRRYFTDQIDDRENIYHFNPKTNIIAKVDYRLNEYTIFLDKYVKIETHVNGLKGLAEVETGKIVLPMEHSFLNLEEGKFWHLKKEEKEGVLDVNFKVIMPITYDGIDVEDGYIFVKKKHGNRIDAYNENGKNLINGKFNEIIGTFSNGLLLVATEKKTKEGYSQSHYYYIDDLCKIKIDATAKNYYEPKEFSAGMAVVENKDGTYGYIDSNGELAIPFQYKFAHNFYPTSQLALVELNDEVNVLIDKQGKIIKKLYK
ncbi:WG repeat-containing protein [Chryseobacterium sp. EO14]|uniref:WG repeat-containing protein n=1 Tax=Chryseobacterium sp. EO14 TaxID=2950551 RepID=UPI00210C49E1|nr:WG repeat-containing protein [Chryseobacterium sp. EO14]MCQ4142652.1 WG repeat-containing protein [Chryseobacterium sp. EO14]